MIGLGEWCALWNAHCGWSKRERSFFGQGWQLKKCKKKKTCSFRLWLVIQGGFLKRNCIVNAGSGEVLLYFKCGSENRDQRPSMCAGAVTTEMQKISCRERTVSVWSPEKLYCELDIESSSIGNLVPNFHSGYTFSRSKAVIGPFSVLCVCVGRLNRRPQCIMKMWNWILEETAF